MPKNTKVIGRWWIFGKTEDPQLGSLNIGKKGIRLKIMSPANRSRMDALIASTEEREVAPTIFGCDEDDRAYTLINCSCTHFRYGRNRDELVVVAGLCIQGQEVESLEKTTATYVNVSPRYFHRWLGVDRLKLSSHNETEITYTMRFSPKRKYGLGDGVTLTISQDLLPSRSLEEQTFSSYSQIALLFREPLPLSEIMTTWIPRVIRFFSLLYGDSLHYSGIGYTNENPFSPPDHATEWQKAHPDGGKIVTHSGLTKSVKQDAGPLLCQFAPLEKIEPFLQDMLQRWCVVDKRLRPVVDLFWAVTFESPLYADAAFLFVVQALEVYHARSFPESTALPPDEHRAFVEIAVTAVPEDLRPWLKRKIESTNYKSLRERLLEIFREHSVEVKELLGDPQIAAKRITDTRNHLTHYNARDSSKVLDDNEMFRTTNALQQLIWILLLKEIGLPRELVNDARMSLRNLIGLRDI
jgi:hypothetical protein